jgi:hypothetical protein
VHAQRLRCCSRRPGAPELVDQTVGGHSLRTPQEEQREQRAASRLPPGSRSRRSRP